MYYLIIDEKGNDIFVEAYTTKEEAIKMINLEYANLSEYDKKQRKNLYVLEAETPDELDGNIVYRIV